MTKNIIYVYLAAQALVISYTPSSASLVTELAPQNQRGVYSPSTLCAGLLALLLIIPWVDGR